MSSKFKIEYTVETRNGSAVRKSKEVSQAQIDKTIAKLEDKGAYNIVCSMEK